MLTDFGHGLGFWDLLKLGGSGLRLESGLNLRHGMQSLAGLDRWFGIWIQGGDQAGEAFLPRVETGRLHCEPVYNVQQSTCTVHVGQAVDWCLRCFTLHCVMYSTLGPVLVAGPLKGQVIHGIFGILARMHICYGPF